MESGRKRAAMIRVVTSTSAAARLSAARAFLRQLPIAAEALIVGATRGAAADIGQLLARMEDEFGRAAVDDRAALFRLATAAVAAGQVRWASLPVVLLDVPLDAAVEREFIAALARRTPSLLATVPEGDD